MNTTENNLYAAAINLRKRQLEWAIFAGYSNWAENYKRQITLIEQLESDDEPFPEIICNDYDELWGERFFSVLRHRKLMAEKRRNIPDGLPPEVSTEVAAEILGCSKDTVLKFKSAGVLEFRNAAPPMSSRPVFKFTLESVKELRTAYERDEPIPTRPKEKKRHRVKTRPKFKHVQYEES